MRLKVCNEVPAGSREATVGLHFISERTVEYPRNRKQQKFRGAATLLYILQKK
jgi:hypothetical protein